MPDDLAPVNDAIILDACCVITLHTTGRMSEILTSLPKPVLVSNFVYEEEVLQFDLESLVVQGLLDVVSPESEEEFNEVINFSINLGDGESVTGALAIFRNYAIATDDRKAINVFSSMIPPIELISTLAMIKYWADHTNPSKEEIKAVLEDLRNGAPYEPKSNHPLYAWWHRHIS